MMNFADLERAYLTLAFLREFPDAVDVRIFYRRAAEQIGATVAFTTGESRRYTFQISSDDNGYLFVDEDDSLSILLAPSLPTTSIDS